VIFAFFQMIHSKITAAAAGQQWMVPLCTNTNQILPPPHQVIFLEGFFGA
jgi:hypothetical protein